MDTDKAAAWGKCLKQVRGAIGCVIGLKEDWPGTLSEYQKAELFEITKKLCAFLVEIKFWTDKRTDATELFELLDKLDVGQNTRARLASAWVASNGKGDDTCQAKATPSSSVE